MRPPEKRKPVASKATGFLKIEQQASTFDNQEDSPIRFHLQASLLRNRFGLSWPIARVVAEFHFGRAA